jgi:alpha-tubulin suppressor-like RCC1 family protein
MRFRWTAMILGAAVLALISSACFPPPPPPPQSTTTSTSTTTTSTTTTTLVPEVREVRVSSGSGHNCAIVPVGEVRCWGRNDFGQLGNGSTTDSLVTVAVSGLSGVTQISAGSQHTCAVLESGEARCWGRNDFGQLGTGSASDSSPTPVAVNGLAGVTQIVAGHYHTCALVNGGEVRCWGQGIDGRLGNGATVDSSEPVAVVGLSGATQIAAGGFHSCAVVSGGEVRCWGYNDYGVLGNGSTVKSSTPVAVSGLSGVTQISAGSQHTCAVLEGGEARCWGWNNVGQLGNGAGRNFSLLPVTVIDIAGVTQIAAGHFHTCAILSGGDARCWGSNNFGQLGYRYFGGFEVRPKVVSGLSGGTQIASGNSDSCAVVMSREVQCWGSLANSAFPVSVGGLA